MVQGVVDDVASILRGSHSTVTYTIKVHIIIIQNNMLLVDVYISHVYHTFPWVHVDPIYNYTTAS
jgi:hypothetical protein